MLNVVLLKVSGMIHTASFVLKPIVLLKFLQNVSTAAYEQAGSSALLFLLHLVASTLLPSQRYEFGVASYYL